MVRRILNILNWEIGGLHEAAFLLAISSLSSQILALLRDRLLAGTFGAGKELDIYYASFRIPDLVFISLGSFLAITVLIPLIISKVENNEKEGIQKARKFISELMTIFTVFMIFASIIIFFAMPFLAKFIAPGFDKDSLDSLIMLSRILLLSPFFLGLSNLFGSITQSFKKFFVYALSPIFYNLGIILGVIFFYPIFGLQGLALGVSLGAFMHFAIQMPAIYRMGMFPLLTTNINLTELKKVSMLSLPRTFALGANQIAVISLIALGSLMKEGSIAVFNLSFNLQSVPLAIIGVSYATAAFPDMSRIYSKKNINEFVSYLEKAIKHIFFWSVPVVVLFIVLRAQIVRTILGSGNFGWDDTRLTAAALAIFCLSVVAQNLIQLLDRVYYATGNTWKPVVTKVFSAVSIIASAYFLTALFKESESFKSIFEFLFRVEGISGTEILMLPLAYSVGSLINLLTLFLFYKFDFKNTSGNFKRTILETVSASILIGAVSYFMLQILSFYLPTETFFGIFEQGFVSGIFGVLAGVILLKLLRSEELQDIEKALKEKFWKAETISPGPEEI